MSQLPSLTPSHHCLCDEQSCNGHQVPPKPTAQVQRRLRKANAGTSEPGKPTTRTLLPKPPPTARSISTSALLNGNAYKARAAPPVYGRLIVPSRIYHDRQVETPMITNPRRAIDRRTRSRQDPSILPPLAADGVDWSTVMPSGLADTGFLKHLFRYFCVDLFDRLETLLVPPAMVLTRREQLKLHRHSAVEAALCSPIHFLNATAAAYYHRTLRRGCVHSADRDYAILYGEILKLLRKELRDLQPASAALLISVVMFDVASGKIEALSAHRNAMVALVRVCGGIHNLGPMLPYTLSLDRNLAIGTDQAPLYSHKNVFVVISHQTARFPKIYGQQFDHDLQPSLVHREIRQFCTNTCRAIEILERSACTFDPDEILDSTEIHYLYFLRESVFDQFTHLNAEHLTGRVLDRSVLLATHIVSYITLRDNYVVEFPSLIASRLHNLIITQIETSRWDASDDISRWLLFVLASMPDNRWKDQDAAKELLRESLTAKYGAITWPAGWVDTERRNVWRHTWSESRLGGVFNEICRAIEPSNADTDDGSQECCSQVISTTTSLD